MRINYLCVYNRRLARTEEDGEVSRARGRAKVVSEANWAEGTFLTHTVFPIVMESWIRSRSRVGVIDVKRTRLDFVLKALEKRNYVSECLLY